MKELEEFEALGEGALKVLPVVHRVTVGALFKAFVKVLRAIVARVDQLERVAHEPRDFTQLYDRVGALERDRFGQPHHGHGHAD